VGITAAEKLEPPRTQVQEVTSAEPGVRVFVAQSEERLAYERTQRLRAMEQLRAELRVSAIVITDFGMVISDYGNGISR
jgi:hypothetical protein